MILIYLTTFLISVLLVNDSYAICPRTPAVGHSRRPKSEGDNGYRIYVDVQNDEYEPDKVYTVSLKNILNSELKFRRFLLTTENLNATLEDEMTRSGIFQLFDEPFTKFNEECVNTISEQNDNPKREIEVMWKAPPKGSGCVAIRAMVLQNRNSWFADAKGLSKTVCEKSMIDKNCCACDDAKYKLIFEGIWSKKTHPKDFPTLEWLLHFSDLIGASHEENFSFWGEKKIATDGFRTLAEWGSAGSLDQELRLQSKHLRSIIRANGLWHPSENGNTTTTFKVDRRNHRMSVVSMFGPSPDWVVGVNGLELCLPNCSWIENIAVDLYPWDSGTDNGVTYLSPNAETNPREMMRPITTKYPEDPRAPFYNLHADTMPPLARLYLTREKLIPRNCDDEFLSTQLETVDNTDDALRGECEVTSWSSWSACSVTCGKGLKMRTREYLRPQKAQMSNCDRQLVQKVMCSATVPECGSDQLTTDEDDEEDLTFNPVPNMDMICKTSPWGPWSECSTKCGEGVQMRTRLFIDPMGRKKCPHVTQVEKKKCMITNCQSQPTNNVPDDTISECKVTDWSEWSPCIATQCDTTGYRIRMRYLLGNTSPQDQCSNVVLQQRIECTSEPCQTNLDPKDVCMQPKVEGPCRDTSLRWYFEPKKLMCVPFNYGGCRGNENNFESEKECNDLCQTLRNSISTRGQVPPTESNQRKPPRRFIPLRNKREIEPLELSEWSLWSSCSVSCGEGVRTRQRHVVSEPKAIEPSKDSPELLQTVSCIMGECP